MSTTPTRRSLVLGWLGVAITTTFLAVWSFWGILENFHEGWYYKSYLANLALMAGQYFLPMVIFLVAGLAGVRFPRLGGALHLALAGGAAWFFGFRSAGTRLIASPLVALALLYWFGRARPERWAYRVMVGVPLLTMIGFGIAPAWRVAHRVDDGVRGERTIEGNGVTLRWAPAGPGWPDRGVPWAVARDRCAHLTADGTRLAETPQHAWRLPTVDEAVRSMVRGGTNAGGQWDPEAARATYVVQPDKETPLWDPYSMVIYWWTATEADSDRAYRVVYNGLANTLPKQRSAAYLAYRCVALGPAERPSADATRAKALEELRRRVSEPERLEHAFAVEAIMVELARRIGGDGPEWGLAGLLHDIDRAETDATPLQHGIAGARLLSDLGFSDALVHAVQAHDDVAGVARTSPIAHALYCADRGYWAVRASGLRLPSPEADAATPTSIILALEQKHATDRVDAKLVAECGLIGLTLEDLLGVCLGVLRSPSARGS